LIFEGVNRVEQPLITGATRLLGIVGDPIAQVRSPPLWTALFRRNGIDAVCVPFHVHPPALPGFIDGLGAARNLIGLIVTVPHKAAAAAHAGSLTARAKMVGTANLLRPLPGGGWEGDILDGEGFVGALRADNQTIAGRKALVVGAGGVGSAIAFALAEAGVASLALADIDAARAGALASRITSQTSVSTGVAAARAAGFDLVVNASPIGMRPDDPMPIDLTGLSPSAIVADVVIKEGLTPVLSAARQKGCHVQRGAAMTDHQIAGMAAFLGLDQGDWSPEAIAAAIGT
jgi:shikimate dehydrogenase